jgi:hypothetical protein
MGNITNEENWAAQERLRAIERALWWRGWVKRKNLQQLFGLSLAQSSSDLQKYLELNPGAMVYHLNHKRYEASDSMQCRLHVPLFEDAIRSFIPSGNLGQLHSPQQVDSEFVSIVSLPNRSGKAEIQRLVLQAFLNSKKIKLKYWSLSSGSVKLREIIPTGFGNDGYRWHVRAWCCENEDYRDFVLGRISLVQGFADYKEELPSDAEWHTLETVRLKPNSKLPENSRRALELDYGIRKNGTLKLEVRTAMKDYFLSHMRVSQLDLLDHFELLK